MMTFSLRALAAAALAMGLAYPQSLKDIRAQGTEMLESVRKTVEKNYFDPAYGGVDLRAVFDKAKASIEQAQSAGHTFGIIAQALVALEDSHTFFIPPTRVAKVRYGWRMSMIGDKCLVTGVKPQSDAESKGVRPGDEILAIEGFQPNRRNLWKMRQMYYSLQPRPSLRLALRSPDGRERQVEIAAAIRTGKQVVDLASENAEYDYYEMLREAMSEASVDAHRIHASGRDLMIYRMPDFSIDLGEVDRIMGRARDFDRLIIDMRGNSGGAVSTLERVAGHLLGTDVVLAERKGRKSEKPIRAQAPGKPVQAKLVLIVDSDSASAAEILARAVQIEKRGTVIGDRTAGAVRQSRQHSLELGYGRVVLFGVSVTNADLIMKDGKSVEHAGVVPDELALLTPAALAAGEDTVLAHAAKLLGVEFAPSEAGKLFPRKWLN